MGLLAAGLNGNNEMGKGESIVVVGFRGYCGTKGITNLQRL